MKLIALAYYYPPNAGSGTHRSLHFLNRLAVAGDDVTVITAKEEDFSADAMIDPELMSKVDTRIRIVRVSVARPFEWLIGFREAIRRRIRGQPQGNPAQPATGSPPASQPKASGQPQANQKSRGTFARGLQALKDGVTGALTFPDEHVGWITDAVRQGSRVIRAGSADCIYSTGGPWSPHLAAAILRKRHRLPLVLDFRDPWASNPDRASRSRLARSLDKRLEAFCIRAADHVVLNTEPLREDFIRRYPREPKSKFTTITNGFESIVPGARGAPGSRFTLVHAGEIYLSRNPASFLRAVLELIRRKQVDANEICVQFVGGCSNKPEVIELLATEELQRVVEVTPRVPHSKALQYQLAADALLLFQTGFPLQIPRKLFEYMSLMKPVLAITEPRSATAAVVQESGVGIVADQDVESLRRALLELYENWKHGARGSFDEERVLRYRNESLAMRPRAILHAASESQPARAIGVPDA